MDVLVDEGVSRKGLDRPGLATLIRRCEAGETAHVIVWRLDRLTRVTRHLAALTEELFLARRIELHSVSESLDTSSPHGRFVLTLFGGLAQMERELIAERTRSALAYKRANGQPTSHPPLGFRQNGSKKHRMIPVPNELAVVRRILDASRAGRSYLAIAGELNTEGVPTKRGGRWHASTVRAVVSSGGTTMIGPYRGAEGVGLHDRPDRSARTRLSEGLGFCMPDMVQDSPFDEIQHPQKRAFLAAYAQLGSKARAAAAVGIDRSTLYTRQWREDGAFQEALELARQMAIDVLEDEAHRRAVEGWEEPVGWYKGKAGGTIRRYSDTLLIFKLKGEAPDKYRDRVEVGGTIRNLDYDKLPDVAIARIVAGEPIEAVLADLALPVVKGLLGTGTTTPEPTR